MTTTSASPFAAAVGDYTAAGWLGLLPLPAGAKFPPPSGFTGPQGGWPAAAQLAEWADTRPAANIALRLPDGVIGIDRDTYDGKPGAATVTAHEALWGELPPTWMSTSREDGSFISYYRTPVGLAWPSQLGGKDDGVEIIRHGHRYAVAPPSIHPDGRAYRWVTPDGESAETIPSPDELTELPDAWVTGLTGGQADRARATAADVSEWISGLSDGEPDEDVQRIVDGFADFLGSGASGSHGEMLRVTWELAVAGATGALGVPSALAEAEAAFVSARTADGGSTREAAREWGRGLAGAVLHLAETAVPVLEPFDVPADVLAAFDRRMTERKAQAAKTYNPTSTDDAHLGARIAEQHLRGRWCWSSGFGWLRWDGRRWENVPETAAQEAIRRALIEAHGRDTSAANARLEARQAQARQVLRDTEELRREMDAAAKEHGDRLRSLRSYFTLGKIKAVLSIAKGVLIEEAESFDDEPYLLNVGNGVVDLRDGTLGPHRPELRFTKLTEVAFRPGACHADWDAALRAMPEDVRDWMRLRFGQAATGFPSSDDVVPFLYGGGANGKTTVVTAILQALGDFAVVIPEKVLLTSPGDHPTEMMTLHGRRLTVLEELPQGRYLDAKRLKSIAGTDRITARLIGKDNVSWVPTHALFVTTNYELRVDENDHGTWRRLARVPFPHRFGDGPGDLPKDPNLRHRMREGRDGQHEAVLAWIVSGAADWHAAGEILPEAPASVDESTREWRGTADVLGRFLDEATELDKEAAVLTREFYDVFGAWCAAHGLKPWGDQLLWERLKAHDVMTSAAVLKPGMARLGGRTFSSASGAAKPSGPARLLLGLRFTDEAKGYDAGARFAG